MSRRRLPPASAGPRSGSPRSGNPASGDPAGAQDEPITPADISRRVREILGDASETAEQYSSAAIGTAASVAMAAVLAAFLFGRRRGRRRSTVVEIIRS